MADPSELHVCTSLPPYSPQLNPVELAFSSLKVEIKRRLAGMQEQFGNAPPNVNLAQHRRELLVQVAHDSIGIITVDKCRGSNSARFVKLKTLSLWCLLQTYNVYSKHIYVYRSLFEYSKKNSLWDTFLALKLIDNDYIGCMHIALKTSLCALLKINKHCLIQKHSRSHALLNWLNARAHSVNMNECLIEPTISSSRV